LKEIVEILRAVDNLHTDEPAVLATVVDVEGSGYRLPGARMLVLANGDTFGTVTGGCLEADVLERARAVIASGVAETFTYDTTRDEESVFSMNMGCRGVIRIRLEPLAKDSSVVGKMRAAYERREPSDEFDVPIRLVVHGAGADAVPLARFAMELGWQVEINDHRPAYLSPERFPAGVSLVRHVLDEPPAIIDDPRTAAVVMTHNYARDRVVLPSLLRSDIFYLGLLGPKRRTKQLVEELAAASEVFEPPALEKLYGPIGLDIGADTPEGIAVAIVAEIQGVLKSRQGGHLRDRAGSIYGRSE
jgi:xanthine/CO dehydrogenase XdhC/CoxF family maturation factor